MPEEDEHLNQGKQRKGFWKMIFLDKTLRMAQRTQVLLAFTTQSIIQYLFHLHVIGEMSGSSFAQEPDF